MARRKPYTWTGIRRIPCYRCGKPSRTQWQVCSDGNVYRGLCIECDVELNRVVLLFFGFDDVEGRIAAYRDKLAQQYTD